MLPDKLLKLFMVLRRISFLLLFFKLILQRNEFLFDGVQSVILFLVFYELIFFSYGFKFWHGHIFELFFHVV